MGVKSGFARHGRVIASVILFQSLLIIWLSSWAIGDYSNNQYVRAYVDSTVQSLAWVFGAVVIIGVLGSVLGLIVRRRRGSSLELVGVSPKVPVSTPVARSMPSVSRVSVPVSRPSPVPAPSVTTVSATGTSVTAPKPAVELHPAVAALKAELSEARMSLGLASVATGPQTIMGPANRFDDQRSTQGAPTRSQMANPPGMSSRPQNPVMNQTPPPTVIRPMAPPNLNSNFTPTLAVRPPTPSTVIRPMVPVSGQSVQLLTSPMLRPPAPSQQTPPQVGVPSRPETTPLTPKDVSTVITGIMPVIKKKDEQASSTEQNNAEK